MFIRKEFHRGRRSLAKEYGEVLDMVWAELLKKKEETAAEIRLQEVRARIEVLSSTRKEGLRSMRN